MAMSPLRATDEREAPHCSATKGITSEAHVPLSGGGGGGCGCNEELLIIFLLIFFIILHDSTHTMQQAGVTFSMRFVWWITNRRIVVRVSNWRCHARAPDRISANTDSTALKASASLPLEVIGGGRVGKEQG